MLELEGIDVRKRWGLGATGAAAWSGVQQVVASSRLAQSTLVGKVCWIAGPGSGQHELMGYSEKPGAFAWFQPGISRFHCLYPLRSQQSPRR